MRNEPEMFSFSYNGLFFSSLLSVVFQRTMRSLVSEPAGGRAARLVGVVATRRLSVRLSRGIFRLSDHSTRLRQSRAAKHRRLLPGGRSSGHAVLWFRRQYCSSTYSIVTTLHYITNMTHYTSHVPQTDFLAWYSPLGYAHKMRQERYDRKACT